MKPRSAISLAAFVVVTFSHSAYADSATWNGTTDAIWATDTNWSTSPVPGSGNTATFDNAGGALDTIDLGPGVTINTLFFNTNLAAAYTIGSGAVGSQTLTLDNGGAITLDASVAANQLVNAGLILGNDGTAQTFTLTNASTTNSLTVAGGITGSAGTGLKTLAIAGAGATTLSGIIWNGTTGAVALTKADAGTLTLSNTGNTFSGGLTIGSSAGTVTAATNSGTNVTGLGTGAVSIGSGSTLNLLSSNTVATQTTINNAITGTGLLKVTFTNTTATNTALNDIGGFTGTIQLANTGVNGDKLNVSSLGNIAPSLIVDSGSQLFVSGGTVNFTGSNGISLNGTGNNENRGAIRMVGAAVLGGNISLAGNSTIGLDSTAGSYLTGNISSGVAGTQTLTFGGSGNGNGTLSGVLSNGSGTFALTKNNTGTLSLTNTNTYTGATTISSTGRLQLGLGGTTGSLSPSSTISVATGASLVFNRSNAMALGTDFGAITGAGNVAQNGTGTTTFSPAATMAYTGQTQVNRGTLTLDFANIATTNVVSASSVLNLGGGKLSILGRGTGTSQQTFASTTVSSGGSIIAPNRGTGTSTTLTLGAVTRGAGGTISFQPNTTWAGGGTTTTAGAASTTEIVTVNSVSNVNGAVTMPTAGNFAYIGAGFFNGTGTATRYIVAQGAAAAPYQLVGGPVGTTTTATTAANVTSSTTVYTLANGTYTAGGALTGYALLGNNSASTSIVLGTNTLTLNGYLGIGAGTTTISGTGALTIGTERDFVVNLGGAGGLAVSAPIANNGANVSNVTVSSTGTGAFAPTGANTYSGITTINSGTLAISTDGANGAASSQLGAVPGSATAGKLVFNGGTLSVVPTADITLASNRGILLNAGGGTVTNAATGTARSLTMNAIIAGVGGLTLNTAGIAGNNINIGGANTYTGGTTLSGTGNVVATNNAAFGVGGTLTLNGATLRGTTSATTTINNPVNIAANTTFPTVASEKTLIFSGPASLSGTRTLNSAIGSTAANTSLQFTNGISESTALSGLTKAGAGEIQLSGLNTYTGPTAINAGRLTFGKNFSLYANTPASWTAANITVSSGATMNLRVGGSNEFTSDNVNAIAALGTATNGFLSGSYLALDTTSGNFAHSGTIANTNGGANAIGFMKLGSNSLTLSGPNSYTGSTFIGGGTLVAGNASAFGPSGNNVYFMANTAGASSGANLTSGNLELATDTTVNAYILNTSSSFANTLTLNRATAGVGFTQNLGQFVAGNNNLTVVKGANVTSGMATVAFTGMNLGGGSAGTSTLTATDTNISITGAVNIGFNSNAKTLALDGNTVGNSISGDITNNLNTLSLTKNGASTWTLSGNNSYSGTTTVNAGTLILSGTHTGSGATNVVGGTLRAGLVNAFGPGSAITMTDAAAAVLDLNDNSNSIASLAGGGSTGGNVTLGSATLTTGGNNNSTSYAGNISGGGNLVKTGTGTFTLASPQGYTGTTAVNAGTLLVNSALASGATTVADSATLGGIGTLANSVTVNAGGNLSPATATTPGTLTVGALTLDAGSTLAYEFGGTSDDLVAVTTANGLTLNGGGLNLYAAGGLTPLTTNNTYTLFTYSGVLGGALTNLSVLNSQAGKTYAVTNTGTAIQLIVGTATTSDWTGTAGDLIWTSDGPGGNWNDTAAPNALGAVANFGTVAAPTAVTLNGGKTVGTIIFNSANAFTIGTNADAITLDNGIAAGAISAGTGSHTINAPIILNGPANITPSTGTSITYGGIISGTGKSLTFSGAGANTLNAANTYSGGTTLSAGTLNLGNDSAIGTGALTITGGTIDATGGSRTLSANNTVTVNGDFAFTGTNDLDLGTGAVSIPVGKTITVNASTLTVGGVISGAGLSKAGAGTLALTGNNTFTGALTLNTSGGMTILSGNNSARPAGSNGLTTVNSGATLQLQANGGNTAAGISSVLSGETTANQPLIINTGGALQLRSDNPVTFAGANNFGGLGGATIGIDVNQLTGAGTNNQLTLAPGGFNVSNTTINVTGANGYSLRLPAITSVAANTSTYNPTTANLSIGSYTATAASTLGLAGTSTGNIINGVISNGTGSIAILKTGASTWELSGANTYTGATTVSEGTLTLSGARTGTSGAITVSNAAGLSAILNITNGTLALAGNSFSIGSAPTTVATGTVNQSGGAVSFGTSGNQMLLGNGGIANTANYNLSGGSLTVSVSSTANRGIILGTNANSLANFQLSNSGTLNMTLASGGTGDSMLQIGRYDSDADNTTNVFSQTGGTANIGILSIGGNGGTGSGVSSTLTLTGGTFAANQFPRLALGDSNTATINIGGSADVTLPAFPTARGSLSTATINFDGGILRPLAASTTYMGGLTNVFVEDGGAKFDVASGKDITVAQSLLEHDTSTGGGLTKDGTGALTLTGTSTYTGPTTITSGTLQLGNAASTGSLSPNSSIINNANLTIKRNNPVAQGTDFSASAITGSGTLAYTGDSTLTLNANSYSGLTTFSPTGTNSYTSKLILTHNNALGTTAAGTVINGATGSGGSGVQLVLQTAGMGVTDESLTLDSGSGKRASLYTNTVGSQTWDGDIVSSGTGANAFWSDAAGSVLVVGSSAADTVTQNATTFFLRGGNGGVGIVNSTITGSGGIVKTDSGTWSIASTTNTYGGVTTISQGVLNIASIADSGSNSSIGSGSGIVMGQNQGGASGTGTLRFTGASGGSSNRPISINNGSSGGAGVIENTVSGQTLTLSGDVTAVNAVAASALTLQGAGNGMLTGSITGSPNMSLNKSGDGTWTLSGTNTYSGPTTISGGTLALGSGGSIDNSSGVILNNGTFNVSALTSYSVSSLTGSGSVTGDLTVTGTLGIGASPGTVTFNDDLTLGASSISNFEIDGFGLNQYDLADSGIGSQTVTFGGTLNLLFASGFNTNGTVRIFKFENYTGNFNSVTFNPGGLADGYSASFDATTGYITVIPEPRAAMLGILGTLALLRRRRSA